VALFGLALKKVYIVMMALILERITIYVEIQTAFQVTPLLKFLYVKMG
jgi:hypothetical protein